ncbi:hypothetical protein LCGC14_2026480, partial [marine sediment metagenome]
QITQDELIASDFTLEIDLPTGSNSLSSIEFTPFFRTDLEYSTDNVVGVPKFEFIEWDSTKTNYDSNGNRIMFHTLENPLYNNTESPNYELAYLFNEDLQYLALPEGTEFAWSDESLDGALDLHVIQIPELFIDPNDSSVTSIFEDGDIFMIRYNSPVEKTIQIGIEELFFRKKPFNYDTFSEVAEVLLINTDDISNYTQFKTPYSYNISLPITPFQTEYLGDYRDFTAKIDLSTLSQHATNGYIDFSNIVISVPNPAYELTIQEIGIYEEKAKDFPQNDVFSDYIWRNTEKETIITGIDPSTDAYQLDLINTPLFYNDPDKGKWLKYLNIYDENKTYFSAGLQGDEFQLIWDPDTSEFSWNSAFNQFQNYWGFETNLPLIAKPESELTFEYSHNTSWSESFSFNYENLDAGTLLIIYEYDYLLKPRYFTRYNNTLENTDYDYEFEQFYSESFTVYSDAVDYTHTFDIDYDLSQDFANLALYRIVGVYPNLTQFYIVDDENYDIIFNPSTNSITVIDLISGDGVLNQFDSITVILNFTLGPVSTLTQLTLSTEFNQDFLSDPEVTISDEIYGSFNCFNSYESYLFAEDYATITSDSTSFSSIDFTRNPHLGNSLILKGYNEYELYLDYELSENMFNTIYLADIDQDGEVDYKQEVDIDKNGEIDITKYGIQDPENSLEILWYKIIQDYETFTKTVEKGYEYSETDWWEVWNEDVNWAFNINKWPQ